MWNNCNHRLPEVGKLVIGSTSIKPEENPRHTVKCYFSGKHQTNIDGWGYEIDEPVFNTEEGQPFTGILFWNELKEEKENNWVWDYEEMIEENKTSVQKKLDEIHSQPNDLNFNLEKLSGILIEEKDPSGKSPKEAGAKLDQGKNRLGLVLGAFSRALREVGKVGTFGANKYSPNGWISVPDAEERYTDAMLRHYIYEATGEEIDPESNLKHSAHFAWNALARLELQLRKLDENKQQRHPTPCGCRGKKASGL